MTTEDFDAFTDTFEQIALRVDRYVMEMTEARARIEKILTTVGGSDELRKRLVQVSDMLDNIEKHLAAARKDLERN